ncbi:SH3 domain-containing protein [Streptomyces sp. NPDC051172]|uniref:SH3 domain-containing protein n=1 Tax=Streptomyces sp. NPDC051172 TaxID=3155796 RepID=UPI003429A2A9
MSLRSTLIRLATATAACALVSSVAVSPALADDEWGGGEDPGSGQGGEHDHDHDHDRLARGVVTAETLLLRSAPNRGSQVIRVAHRGERVSIFCKTPGQSVDGDNIWYLLPDGTWAWGAARFIEVIGHEQPRWC